MTDTGANHDLVLVTGGSGFVGTHCILQLLDAGHRVRTTVRSLDKEPAIRSVLSAAGAEPGDRLAFFAADLMSDTGWAEAVSGCDYVLHVASPFPMGTPEHEDDLIIPARDGALRVLRASLDAGVKRVVLTSSFAAVGYGVESEKVYTEDDWTDPSVDVGAYVKSKTLAERAAWDFIANEGGSLELSVVNPVAVLGPVLVGGVSTSIQIVERLLKGGMPGLPDLSFSLVDVRDVADLHLRAMTDPAAKGERFLAVAGPCMTMQEIGAVLRARMGNAAKRVPTRVLPDWMIRAAAVFDRSLKLISPELGRHKNASHDKATRLLGWTPRSNEEAIVATAESLIRLDLLR